MTVVCVLLSGAAGAGELTSAEAEAAQAPEASRAAAFADSLFERADFYRAIGEYERALFLAPTSPEEARWELQIARAYAAGEQDFEAAKAFERVAKSHAGAVKVAALLGAARAHLGAGTHESAVARARDAAEAAGAGSPEAREARYLEGWALLETGRDVEAKEAFTKARGEGASDPVGLGAARLLEVLPQLDTLPSKSPLLAGALGFIPGAGHLYLGDPGTAVSALVWNGVFIWALVDRALAQEWSLVVVLSMFEAMWYGGSIIGSVSGAHRYNRDARVNALEDLARISSKDLRGDVGTKSTDASPIAPPARLAFSFEF